MMARRLIERKRDREEILPEEWARLITEYMAGSVPDYQMAALLMAVTLRGMSAAELTALTEAMLASGSRLDFHGWTTPRVDKHSTGGVGDKVSLVLAPLVASCGVAVPMMSGRALGHTGGTVDKLESITGFRTGLTLAQAQAQVAAVGCAMFSQSAEIAPADRRLYALRDVTGTVPSVPLIAASIMSKKLAEDLQGLVLDVKTGSGAFLADPAQALELARTMVAIGEGHGCRTVALLTAMDRPLGRACGNALEVEEALIALEGKGPEDLLEVTLTLGVEMLLLAGVAGDAAEAGRQLRDAIDSGRALDCFRRIIEAQNGNPAVVDDPGLLPQARAVEIYEAPQAGSVRRVDPRPIGQAIVEMGGGRRRLEDAVDHSVGFVITAKPGRSVAAGEPIASVFARDEAGIALGMAALGSAIEIGEPAEVPRLISARVTAGGAEVPGTSGA